MEIKIRNWQKYNGRRDVKACTWFRVNHDLFDGIEMYGSSHTEFCVWLYLLCCASKASNDAFAVNFRHVQAILGIDESEFKSVINKLVELQYVLVLETGTTRERHADVTQTSRHERTNERTNIEEEKKPLPVLAQIWNQHKASIQPEVKSCSKTRRRNAELRIKEHTVAEWEQCVRIIASTDFCLGKNDRAWIANFDFLIRESTFEKVMEGKYGKATVKLKTAQEQEYEKEMQRIRSLENGTN